jgi:hypothetical protein
LAAKSTAIAPDPFGPPLSLTGLSDGQLIRLRAQIEAEMDRRGLAFSVGSLGEKLAIDYFNSTRGHPTLIAAPAGTKNVDALSRDGERYSIKTLLKARKTGTVYPDPDNPDRQLFEWLLVVHLRPDHGLKSIHRFSWEQFVSLRKWDKRMRAWYISPSVATLRAGQLMMDGIQVPHRK